MSSQEYMDLKSSILDLRSMLSLLIPSKATVSFVSETTGKSRQTITQYLQNNFEPEVDYWKENGKIFISKTTALSLLRKYNNER